MRVRKLTAASLAVTLVIALAVAVTMIAISRGPGIPKQQAGTAAGLSHRVPAAKVMGRVVDGRIVPLTSASRPDGPVASSPRTSVRGAVPMATQPKPLRFPMTSKKVTDGVRVLPAPAPAKKTGYNPKTSKPLKLDSASQIVYANADGTKTAFDFQQPVNYRASDGLWVTANPSLVADGPSASATPSAYTTAPNSANLASPATASTPATSASLASPADATSPATQAAFARAAISPVAVSSSSAASPSPSLSSASPAASSPLSSPSAPVSSSPASPAASPSSPATSPSPTPAGTSQVPLAGWTQQSEAEPLTFAPYADAPDLVSMPLGGNREIAFGVAGAAPVEGAVQGGTVSYADAMPDSTLSFTGGSDVVAEQIVLDSPAAPHTWVFPLDLTGVQAQTGPDGDIEFIDPAGQEVAYLPQGVMTDSDVNPHSGNGAMSFGVTYSLTTIGGAQAIRTTLDTAWLDSPARVYPVTVDPSITGEDSNLPLPADADSNGTTYVQSPYNNDYSDLNEMNVGTYDGGTNQTKSFLAFGSVGTTQLQNDTVLGAVLGVFNTWSWSCTPRPVYVYPVTSSWSVTGDKTWPGPSTGAAIGRQSFANGWVPEGSTQSPCKAAWHDIELDQAGTNLINGWTHGTVANDGLALGASGTDDYGWKAFSSDANLTDPAGDPYLAITYTPVGATYSLASRRPVQQMIAPDAAEKIAAQNGIFAVKVKNTGSTTWTSSNGYEMSYELYEGSGQGGAQTETEVAAHPVFTPIPSGTTVAPGQTVTLDVTVDAVSTTGLYEIVFDMYSDVTTTPESFSSQGVAPYAIGLDVPPEPVAILDVYPPNGYISPTLTPQLSTTTTASGTGTLSYSFSLTCEPITGQTCIKTAAITSGTLTTAYWTPPIADMQWNTKYQWTVTVTNSDPTTGSSPNTSLPVAFTPEVPQPPLSSALGGSSGQAYDPLSGNYTTSATDAAVASAGPPLQIVRTYNSMNPSTSGAFGTGWSSVVDTSLQPDNDGTGNATDTTGDVLITLPDGQQMRFGASGNGVFAAPFGSPDVLLHNLTSKTWTLRDSTGNDYDFNSAGLLTEITNQYGLSQTFTDNSSNQVTAIENPSSGRTLTLAWSGGHVASVTTQAPTSGGSGNTWTYNYTGNELTSACAPATVGTGCTSYTYATSGSQYMTSVLNSAPRTYWQLGDASGTTAVDEVDDNLGTTDGTYNNVTLGSVTGPLAGSTETAASFNGTSSSVSLPNDLVTDGTDVSIGLWFKAASSASGVLFSADAQSLSAAAGNHEPVLYIGSNGELYGEFWNGSVDPIHTSTSVDDGNWHYAVLTADGSSQSLYLDGVQVGAALSGTINNLNLNIDTIGAGDWASWTSATSSTIGYFHGDIGQVALYPHALGPAFITQQEELATTASPELTEVTLPSGTIYEQASYDPATDRLASYTDPNGGQWTISQPLSTGYKVNSDGLGVVLESVTVTDPAGRADSYVYDMLDGGRLVSYSNGVDPPEVYGYDAAGYLAAVSNQDGDLLCFTNDIYGNMLTSTWYPDLVGTTLPSDSTGVTTGCDSATSSPLCFSNGDACTTYYSYATYDTANPLDPDNDELTGVRDGRSASATDNTYLTSYAYNSAGQLTSVTTPPTSDFPDGRTTSYKYSTTASPTAAYNGTGNVPAGLLLSETTPGGAVTGYAYYSDGDLAQVTEPSGQRTVYTYNAVGQPTQSTEYTTGYASGLVTTYSYDALDQPLTVTYPSVPNAITDATNTLQDAYAYDDDGDLASLTETDTTGADAPRTTSYTYNDHDEVETVTQPAGATTGGTAQSEGAASANPQGATTAYDYDGFGNVTSMTDPDGNQYLYSYNEYNEVTQEALQLSQQDESNPSTTCTGSDIPNPNGGCELVLDSYAYSQAGLLASATDAMGRITNYTYDNDQQLIGVASSEPCSTSAPCTSLEPCTPQAQCTSGSVGQTTIYGYDGAGNLTLQQVEGTYGGAEETETVTNYTVDAADRLTGEVIDPTPTPTTNQPTSESGYTNRSVSFAYNADNRVTAQTVGSAAEGGTQVTDYGYDPAGDLTSQTVQDGSTAQETTWTYNESGQPLSMTTPEGNVSGATAADYTTTYAYDQAGNLASETGAPVATQAYSAQTPATTQPATTYGYDTFGDQSQVEDPDGNVTDYGYDGDGRVASVTQPSYTPPGSTTASAGTTSYAYDEDGNLVQETDPENNVTQYAYDALGDLTSVTEPLLPGQSAPGQWTFTYDADGEQLSATDPLNNTTSATYNYYGERATATDALGNTTQYAYDYLGDQANVTTPDGSVTTNTYDDLGELTSTADGLGDTSKYAYTDTGQASYAFNPDGSFTQYGYDQAGNLTSVGDYGAAAAGQATVELRSESLGYDPDGDLTSAKDWDGNTTNYAYNAAGELTSQVTPVSSSSSDTTSYGYDPAGNQTSVTDGNGNTTWTTYNAWNLPESVVEPATPAAPAAANRTWTTGYDPDGQAASVTQPGGISLAYTYNPLGEVTGESGSGASAETATQTFGYDLDGRLTSASAPGGTDAYTYYPNSNPKSASGPSGTSSYQYNNDGLVSSEIDAAGTTAYTYDAADRLATEAEPLTGATLTYGYNANSQPVSVGYSSGPTQAFAYNALGELASDTVTSSGTTLASEAYGYDPDGNLTSQTTGGLMTDAATTTYGYDEADQLTSATTGGTTTNYAYDAAGNQTKDGGTTYAYDAQDQVTSSTAATGTTDYGYTLSGALASVTPPGGGAEDYTSDAYGDQITAPGGIGYAYDALGRLVTRTAGSGSASLSYLGTGDTLAFDGTSDYSYTPSGDLTAEQTPGDTAYATMSDVHGDVAATFSPTAGTTTLGGSATYSPYGTPTTSGYSSNIGYQGDYVDPTTGLVEMGARWYNPSTGSFTSNDTVSGSPLSSTVDGNPYAYTSGNPLTETDPSGHYVPDGSGDFGPEVGLIAAAFEGGWDLGSWLGSQLFSSSGSGMPGSTWAPLAQAVSGFQDGDFGGSPAPSSWGPDPADSTGGSGSGGSGGASAGDGVSVIIYTPPPPPPPDCYAGPAATCTPPQAPESLREKQWITRINTLPSITELFKDGHGFDEGVRTPSSTKTTGTKVAVDENGAPGNSSGSSLIKLLHAKLGDFQPTTPTASTPTGGTGGSPTPTNSGITVTEANTPATAAGGSNMGQGGSGSVPPTSNGACGPDDNGQSADGLINPSTIRFSQKGISPNFSNGNSIADTVTDLINGDALASDFPIMRLVQRDGNLFTLDNRRLVAFQQAGLCEVPYRMATPDEIDDESWKFDSKTNGQSIKIRGGGGTWTVPDLPGTP